MIFSKSCSIIFILLLSPFAFGEQSADDIITSNSLRAMSGSLSKWSFASTWNYSGGNIPSPFAQNRPNIAEAAATTSKTDIDGSVNIKYNFNVNHALMAGFGVRYIAPFSDTPGDDYAGNRFDATNPIFIFQYLYNAFGAQALVQAKVMQWTQTDQMANGYAQQLAVDQETMYPIKGTGLSLALSTVVVYNIFNKNGDDLAASQSQYQIQVGPYAEYKLNDTYNLKTMLNLFFYEHYRSETRWTRDTVIQSIGVGISIARDIFLYPNVSFIPFNLSPQLTNVGVNLTLNLF